MQALHRLDTSSPKRSWHTVATTVLLVASCVVLFGLLPDALSLVLSVLSGLVLAAASLMLSEREDLDANANTNRQALSPGLLTAGYLCLPFLFTLLAAFGLRLASWPHLATWGNAMLVTLCIVPGALLFRVRYGLSGARVLNVIPYSLFFSSASGMFFIIPAMLLLSFP